MSIAVVGLFGWIFRLRTSLYVQRTLCEKGSHQLVRTRRAVGGAGSFLEARSADALLLLLLLLLLRIQQNREYHKTRVTTYPTIDIKPITAGI